MGYLVDLCHIKSETMSMEIKSRVIKTELIKWRDLEFIQDDDFKEWINDGDKKLQESIVKYQFIDPFKVWESKGKLFCLDGKHRWKDLHKVAENGIEVPDLLPATFIECTDIKEAAEMVLVYSSAYARITYEGLFNFGNKFDLNLSEYSNVFNLPDINLLKFGGDLNNDFSDHNQEFDIEEFKDDIILKLKYTKDSYIDVKAKIEQLMQQHEIHSAEDLIKKLLTDACQ